jgi:signal transduction histidine kinase
MRYRGPLLAGVVLVAGLGWWTALELRALEQRHRAELQRFVDGALLALDASHDLLRPPILRQLSEDRGPGGAPPPSPGRFESGPNDLRRLQPVLQRMVRGQSRIRWIAVLSSDRVVARAGPLETLPAIDRVRGSQQENGLQITWRPLGAPTGARRQPASGPRNTRTDERGSRPSSHPDRADRPVPAGAPVAVIAMDTNLPPEARRRGLLQIGQKIGAAAVSVVALLVAWVLGIRGRALAHELEAEQVRRGHLEELSLAASGLAHETKNPLGIIRGIAQSLQRSVGLSQQQQEGLSQILDESDRAAARLGEFMSYARIRTPELTSVDGSSLLHRAVEVLAVDLESAGVGARISADECRLLADEEMLLQIVLNLMLNSLEASSSGSTITLQLAAIGQAAALTVSDQGRGIEPELRERVFQPYVTGHADGHGLGLAIVRRLVESHGWSIELDSTRGSGTTVTIRGIRRAGSSGTEG